MNSKTTTDSDLVRASRDGDQFHYHWAARHCLSLLPGMSDLAAISIEGASTAEGSSSTNEGDELIDVGFYYGSESLKDARLVRYVQLKHSTKCTDEAWTASGLKKTLEGFSNRFAKLRETFTWEELKDKLLFTFTTNRPIDKKVTETLKDLAEGNKAEHSDVAKTLLKYVEGLDSETANFFKLFSIDAGEPDLWNQRNLLFKDVGKYLAEADSEAPIQLKELVTKKATSEYASNPSIHRFDVLRALGADEADLWPAKCLITEPTDGAFPREQEREIQTILESATKPVILHAEGGVGKSILAWQLSRSFSNGSIAVLYDCFGDGLYRSSQHFRHRQRDALPQIANELAAQGLCNPLIPIRGTDTKQYMRAFVARLTQAVVLLRARTPGANLYLIIDAADNAVMAGAEFNDASFVPDLIGSAMPDGVKLVFTCRTHRRDHLRPPPDTTHIALRPFSRLETAKHLKKHYPNATATDVDDFSFLSSSNPRVQALALSRKLPLEDMLKALGPTPSTVERAISELLERAVKKLKFREGPIEEQQIEQICQGLAVLRPLVPIAVLAEISGTSESAVRSFAYDLGRPLLVKGDSLHFLDEPSETWFRERFWPTKAKLVTFLDRLKPLAANSSYVASTIPQLLLVAGQMDELVDLALSTDGLPTSNPLERRDVEVQRLTFALKACLQERRYASAAKLALKVAGELAGVERQNELIQGNTDIASALLSPDRIDELVSRRTFGGNWTGAHNAYEASLLAGRPEFLAEARSRLRMATDWLSSWAGMTHEEREEKNERVESSDMAELAMAKLLAEGPEHAARFLRGWTPRPLSMAAGSILARRLVDLGRYDLLDQLAEHGARDVWLMLGLVAEACDGGHVLPAKPVERLMRTLSSHRIQLQESGAHRTKWSLLNGVTAAVLQALRVLPRDDITWAKIIRRYLPEQPPYELVERHAADRSTPLRAYALEAALLGKQLALIDLAPKAVREELEKKQSHHSSSSEAEAFSRGTGGVFAWYRLSADIASGRTPADFGEAAQKALKETDAARHKDHHNVFNLIQVAALEWIRAIRDASISDEASLAAYRNWFNAKAQRFSPSTMASVCRVAARTKALESFALEVSVKAFETIEQNREHAESRVESYQPLTRAIFSASKREARYYFERAVEISNHIGQENLARWEALIYLAEASGKSSPARPKSAYRFARATELAYAYVDSDKHFSWGRTIDGLLSLCPVSTIATLSRWRDRKFGDADKLLTMTVERLVERRLLPPIAPIALCPIGEEWTRAEDLVRAFEQVSDKEVQRKTLSVGYRYLRLRSSSLEELEQFSELARNCNFEAQDIDRLLAQAREPNPGIGISAQHYTPEKQEKSSDIDWHDLFNGVDLGNSAELRAAYRHLRTFVTPYRDEMFFHEGLRRCGLGGAAEFCLAVADWPDFGTYELTQLLNVLGKQRTKPVALLKAMAEITLNVCRTSPEWVRRNGWGSSFPYRQLIDEGIVSDRQIVDAVLEGFLAKVTVLTASELFQMLESLSYCLTNDEADDALQFGLSLLESDLRPEDGDGPWHEKMTPLGTCEDALAGYLWATLSSPSTSVRWEAAHSVRATIELGWAPVLMALAKLAVVGTPNAFVDNRFVFYEWHSRLWLTLALARCATEHGAMVRLFGEFLLVSAEEEHVLLRHFAACALRGLPDLLGEMTTRGIPERINASELPLFEHDSRRRLELETETSSDSTGELVDKYYFGIDIGPYWLEPLGEVFGISPSSITRRAIDIIRERVVALTTKRYDDIRYKSGVFQFEQTRHSHGSMPRVEDLHVYAAYHAKMIAAARLLKTNSIGKATYSSKDDFSEWLERHLLICKDGMWAADRRDPQLTKSPPLPKTFIDKKWRWQITADHLDSLLETDEGLLVVAGDWTSGPQEFHETISVTSALVPRTTAKAFLAAAQTSSNPHDYFFQYDGEHDALNGDENTGVEGGPIEPTSKVLNHGLFKLRRWTSDHRDSYGIDEYDPWGERVRVPGDLPNENTILSMGLSSTNFGRRWVTKNGALLRSETWTQTEGHGREKAKIPGSRLSADRAFLAELLAANPEHWLVIGLRLHRPSSRLNSNDEELSSYESPYVRYYLIEEDGIARTLKSSH